MRVVDYKKWNRAKMILLFITSFIALSFVGGLDHTEGEVHMEEALIFAGISIALFINIQLTKQSHPTTKTKEK